MFIFYITNVKNIGGRLMKKKILIIILIILLTIGAFIVGRQVGLNTEDSCRSSKCLWTNSCKKKYNR